MESRWSDPTLRRIAAGRVRLPLETAELGPGDRRRRNRRIAAVIGATVVVATFMIVLTLFGIAREDQDLPPPGLVIPSLAGIAAGVVAALLVHAGLWLAGRTARDEERAPWRFQATEQGFAITLRDGTRLEAPWSRWRLEGYREVLLHGTRIALTSLDLALDARRLRIDLPRVRRREALARAILRGLATAGQAQ